MEERIIELENRIEGLEKLLRMHMAIIFGRTPTEAKLYDRDSKKYAFSPYGLPPEVESYFYKPKGP